MGLAPFGSFERWSDMVRAAMVWAGAADPCESREAVMEDDPDAAQLQALVSAWWARFERTPQNVNEVIKAAKDDDALEEALDSIAGGRGGVDARRLGYWLRSHAGRVVDGRKIIKYTALRCGVQWKVLPMEAC